MRLTTTPLVMKGWATLLPLFLTSRYWPGTSKTSWGKEQCTHDNTTTIQWRYNNQLGNNNMMTMMIWDDHDHGTTRRRTAEIYQCQTLMWGWCTTTTNTLHYYYYSTKNKGHIINYYTTIKQLGSTSRRMSTPITGVLWDRGRRRDIERRDWHGR